jgi:hypothetical protein
MYPSFIARGALLLAKPSRTLPYRPYFGQCGKARTKKICNISYSYSILKSCSSRFQNEWQFSISQTLHAEEALLRQRDIAHLERPNDRGLNAYRHGFKLPRPALLGVSKTFLDNSDDLVALKSSPESDYLSQYLRQHWPAKGRSDAIDWRLTI